MRRLVAFLIVLGLILPALVGQAAQAVETAPQAAPQAAHGIAMHGNPKYGPGFKHFDYVDPQAPKGGTIRYGTIGTFDSLNPYILKGNAAIGGALPFETLMIGSADEAFTEYGLLAETVTTPPDRSWVEFTLRPQARFHDGMAVTPEDVVFSLETLRSKGAPFYRFYYGGIEKVEKTGPRSVRFTFKPGDNRELPLIVGQMPVLPKHYWDGRDFEKTTLEPPLGSGPYRVAAFEPNRSITYERVADYWGNDLPVRLGQNNFDRIRYDYYRDSSVALEAFKAGAYDVRIENEAKKWATGYDFPAMRDGRVQRANFEHGRPSGMQAYAFNTRRAKFTDPQVRRALAYAFDFEWTNRALFYDQYDRTESFFDNSELAAKGLPTADELKVLEPFRGQVPEDVFTKVYQPPETDGSGNARPNLRIADRLLTEAGWVVKDGKRVQEGTGAPLDFEILLVSPAFERISLPFARNLERLGITASVRTVDGPQYQNRVRAFDFDVIVANWGQSLSPGNEQADFWSSNAAQTPGSRNLAGIEDPVVDALVEQIIAAPDRESLITRVRALDRVLLWGHYVIPQWHLGRDRVAWWNKFGQPPAVPMQGVQLDSWWSVADQAVPGPVSVLGPVMGAGAAFAQSPQPNAPLPERLDTPTTPPGGSDRPGEVELLDPDKAIPTPAAESPGSSPAVWLGLAAIVVVVLLIRRLRRKTPKDRS